MDNSLMAIVVLAIIVWEYIQRATPEKPLRKGTSQTDVAKEAPFADAKNKQLISDDGVQEVERRLAA